MTTIDPLKKNPDQLFQLIESREPLLKVGEDSSQVRNIVKKCIYDGRECFIKVGISKDLESVVQFSNLELKTKSFTIPKVILSDEIKYGEVDLLYYIEEAFEGESLYSGEYFKHFNSQIIDIILEIDTLPLLELPRSKEHTMVMSEREKRQGRKEKIQTLMTKWLEESPYQCDEVYSEATDLLNFLMDENAVELSSVHGEFNFHHILKDSGSNISIIDWERASGANFRFFDLAEYLARLYVSNNGTISEVSAVIDELDKKGTEYSVATFRYSFLNRILGSVWEYSNASRDFSFRREQEVEVLSIF